jgi:DNA repair protein RecO (recombination protein O)
MVKKQKDRVLVIRNFRYTDNRHIIDVFSERKGKFSYAFAASKSKRNTSLRILLRPPNWLEIEYLASAKFHPRIVNAVPLISYGSLFSDLRKSAVAIFMSEIISNVISAPDEPFFAFLINTFEALDKKDFSPDFHIGFLSDITRYLGIQPGGGENGIIFAFESIVNLDREDKESLINFVREGKTKNRDERQRLTKLWLRYLAWHLEQFKMPESLKIYAEVFG